MSKHLSVSEVIEKGTARIRSQRPRDTRVVVVEPGRRIHRRRDYNEPLRARGRQQHDQQRLLAMQPVLGLVEDD